MERSPSIYFTYLHWYACMINIMVVFFSLDNFEYVLNCVYYIYIFENVLYGLGMKFCGLFVFDT